MYLFGYKTKIDKNTRHCHSNRGKNPRIMTIKLMKFIWKTDKLNFIFIYSTVLNNEIKNDVIRPLKLMNIYYLEKNWNFKFWFRSNEKDFLFIFL